MSDAGGTKRGLIQLLESMQASGMTHIPWPESLPLPTEMLATAATSTSRPAPKAASPTVMPTTVPRSETASMAISEVVPVFDNTLDDGSKLPVEERPGALHVISNEVSACRKCPELANSRTQTVFGVGNPSARLCLVGEAPGADEDRLGEPFVGAAGQLLDRILKACKLSREDIYILNVIKCRPPRNRTPVDDEVSNCWGFAHRQLEIIQPEFICCLGAIAARAVLQNRSSISRLRGSFHKYRSSQVVVTYHPAYLLRTPTAKQQTWEDMKMLMQAMGVEL